MKVYFFPHLTGKVFNPCKEIITVLDIFFNLKNFNLFSLKIFCIYYGWMVDNFNFCALLVLSKFSIKSLHSGLPRWFSSAKKKKKKKSICQFKRHRFDPWSGEIPHALGATKPLYRNSWACALRPGRHKYWAHVLQLLKPELPRACALQERTRHNEKSPRTTTRERVAPTGHT